MNVKADYDFRPNVTSVL